MTIIRMTHDAARATCLHYSWAEVPLGRPIGKAIDTPGRRFAPSFFLTDAAHELMGGVDYHLVWADFEVWDIVIPDVGRAALFKLAYV